MDLKKPSTLYFYSQIKEREKAEISRKQIRIEKEESHKIAFFVFNLTCPVKGYAIYFSFSDIWLETCNTILMLIVFDLMEKPEEGPVEVINLF